MFRLYDIRPVSIIKCTNIPFLFLDNIMKSRIEREPSIQSLLKEDHEDDFRSKDEPPLDKTNKMAYAPNEDADQSGHSPSLIRVFAVRF